MSASSAESVVIKKYANRRLYNTSTSTYVTLENLAQMVKDGIEFNVYDAKTNEDLTRAVLTQIIVEEEGKSGQNLLPVGFMRNLISFYGDNMQWMVPKYLEQSMQSLTKNQEQIRGYFQTTFGTMFPFGSTLEQMGKQNMAMFERTMKMLTPFAPGTSEGSSMSMGSGSAQDTMSSAARSASDMASESSSAMRSAMQSMQSGMESTMRSAASSVSKTASKAVSESAKTTSASIDSAAAAAKSATDALQEAAEEAAFTPSASLHAMKKVTPMPTPETSRASSTGVSGEDVQNKIAALQRQLSDLAKNKA